MHTQKTDSLSRTQKGLLRLQHARARFINAATVLLAVLVLAVTTLGSLAAPADAKMIVEDGSGTVVAAYEPSMVDRAVIGLRSATSSTGTVPTHVSSVYALGGFGASGPYLPSAGDCNPDDPDSWCYTPAPPPSSICTLQGEYGDTDTTTLPVHRWTDGSSVMHTRLGSKFYDDMMQKVSRNMFQQGLMSAGNIFWSTGVAMTEASAKFCIGDKVGRSIDMAMGKVADAVFFNAGVGMALLVFGIGVIVFRASRTGTPNFAEAGRLFLVGGFITAMIFGATNTTSTAYGTMSPGWMFQKVNNVLANSSGMMSAQLLDALDDIEDAPPGTLTPSQTYAQTNKAHCYNYVERLREDYDRRYVLADARGMTAAPKALDSIWTQSGMRSYITTQFGADNAYGDAVFCHQLELNSGLHASHHAQMTLYTIEGGFDSIYSMSGSNDVFTPRNNEMEDQVMVFWAACQNTTGDWDTGWEVAQGWEGIINPAWFGNDGPVTPEECAAAFASVKGSDQEYNWDDSPFNWVNANEIIDSTPNDPSNFDVRQFLLTYQGHTVGEGMVSSGVHALVGVVIMVLFGLIALVILIAKMAVIGLLSLVFFVAMFDMLTGRASSRLVKFAKLLLGLSIVTWMAGFLLSFLALLTKVINDAGRAMDLNMVGTIIWAGVAPVLAVAMIKFVFDKVLKIPDPLSVSGAKAYLGGAGTIGGATVDRVTQTSTRLPSGAWSRMTGAGAGAGGRGGAVGSTSSRGALGGHSAGRGRDGAMMPDLPESAENSTQATGATVAGARGTALAAGAAGATRAARAAAGSIRPRGEDSMEPNEGADNAPVAYGRDGRRVAVSGGRAAAAARAARAADRAAVRPSRGAAAVGRDGQNLPAELAGSWGRTGDGALVQRARMLREGRRTEREAIGGHSESGVFGGINRMRNARALRAAEREVHRQAVKARRSEMGLVARNVDRLGEAGRKLTSGKVAAGTAAVGAGASLAAAGSFAAVAVAPAAAVGAAVVGTAVAARKLRDVRSGAHAARRAERNNRSIRTFLAQREASVEKENVADETGKTPSDRSYDRDDGGNTGKTAEVLSDDQDDDDDEGPRGGRGGGEPDGDGGGYPTGADAGSRRLPEDEHSVGTDRERGGAAPFTGSRGSSDTGAPGEPAVSDEDGPAWDVSYDDSPSGDAHATRADGERAGGRGPLGQDERLPADETPGLGAAKEGGDAPAAPGPGANADDESRARARRDLWDGDGRPDQVVEAERDVFDHDGVDDEAMRNRRDVFDHDGRDEKVVRAQRDVFDHDGRRDETVTAERDVFDHDGRADDAGGESVEEYHERTAREADERAAGEK